MFFFLKTKKITFNTHPAELPEILDEERADEIVAEILAAQKG